jgi:hypothetical protein
MCIGVGMLLYPIILKDAAAIIVAPIAVIVEK